ncbi:protein JINGUBANG-like [Coffea eugenioides]|uniref:protein JINGUBANG-like n=1 Tax=Coffea eugenioides TaxID=49369 RepID=UPI000F614C82|nr:protein JINGUBANG-like [Coffea eugenioides]
MEVHSWFETSLPVLPKPESLTSSRTSSSGSITIPDRMQYSSAIYEETSFSSLQSDVSQDSSHNSHQKMINSPSVTHSCTGNFQTLTPQISFLAVHGNTLYAASLNEINVFDLTNYCLVDNLSCSGMAKSIAFVENKIFTSHQDCKIRVWQIASSSKKHQLISTLPTVKDRLRRCVLPKNYVQVRRHKQKLWIEHADTISGLAVNDGLIYSVSWDKSFKIWRISDLSCLESVKAHSDAINAIVVCANGLIYTASSDGTIKIWQRNDDGGKKHKLVTTLDKHKAGINALAINEDGSVLFSGGFDENILVWKKDYIADDHMVLSHSLKGHTGAILCLTIVDDLLISGSSDRTVRIWKRSREYGYCCIRVLEGHLKPIKALVAISGRNGDGVISIFSGSLDGQIKVWKVTTNSTSCTSP